LIRPTTLLRFAYPDTLEKLNVNAWVVPCPKFGVTESALGARVGGVPAYHMPFVTQPVVTEALVVALRYTFFWPVKVSVTARDSPTLLPLFVADDPVMVHWLLVNAVAEPA
jgi:hypothetical protein